MPIEVTRPTEDDKDGEGDKNQCDQSRTSDARSVCASATHRARVTFTCEILWIRGNRVDHRVKSVKIEIGRLSLKRSW